MSLRVRIVVFIVVLFVVATLERNRDVSGYVGFLIAAGTYMVVMFPAITRGDRRR